MLALSLTLIFTLCMVVGMQPAARAEEIAQTAGKDVGNSNPLYTQHFGADPWGLEYNGRLYVYMTNDTIQRDGDGNVVDNSYGQIKHINVISSDDLVNWTDHGSIPVAGPGNVAEWAGNSWAPAVVYKNINGKDTFFLYFANSGNGVGVLRGESPIGPWEDPIGKNLVDHKTPNCEGSKVPWCFDPAVFIDDDGTAYLYFGGGIPSNQEEHPKSARVVQLGDDMVSIVGEPVEIDAPYFFEDAGVHKYGDKYYFSYCSNWQGTGDEDAPGQAQIAYMVGDSPMGPFSYVDVILKNPGTLFGILWNNNHHAITKFKDQWYLLYHATLVSDASGIRSASGAQVNYRSTHINELVIGADGKIEPVAGDREGVTQLQTFNPYERVEAETIAWCGGINTIMEDPNQQSSVNLFVTDIKNGSWISVSQANFGSISPTSITARVAGTLGGQIELRLDSTDGPVIGTLDIGAESDWDTVTAGITESVTGVHDLYMIFKGSINNVELFDFDWWQLGYDDATTEEPAETPANTETDPSPSPSAPSEEPTNESGGNGWLVWIVVGAVAVLAAGTAVFVGMKKKRSGSK